MLTILIFCKDKGKGKGDTKSAGAAELIEVDLRVTFFQVKRTTQSVDDSKTSTRVSKLRAAVMSSVFAGFPVCIAWKANVRARKITVAYCYAVAWDHQMENPLTRRLALLSL